jgi:hypothetical protein
VGVVTIGKTRRTIGSPVKLNCTSDLQGLAANNMIAFTSLATMAARVPYLRVARPVGVKLSIERWP